MPPSEKDVAKDLELDQDLLVESPYSNGIKSWVYDKKVVITAYYQVSQYMVIVLNKVKDMGIGVQYISADDKGKYTYVRTKYYPPVTEDVDVNKVFELARKIYSSALQYHPEFIPENICIYDGTLRMVGWPSSMDRYAGSPGERVEFMMKTFRKQYERTFGKSMPSVKSAKLELAPFGLLSGEPLRPLPPSPPKEPVRQVRSFFDVTLSELRFTTDPSTLNKTNFRFINSHGERCIVYLKYTTYQAGKVLPRLNVRFAREYTTGESKDVFDDILVIPLVIPYIKKIAGTNIDDDTLLVIDPLDRVDTSHTLTGIDPIVVEKTARELGFRWLTREIGLSVPLDKFKTDYKLGRLVQNVQDFIRPIYHNPSYVPACPTQVHLHIKFEGQTATVSYEKNGSLRNIKMTCEGEKIIVDVDDDDDVLAILNLCGDSNQFVAKRFGRLPITFNYETKFNQFIKVDGKSTISYKKVLNVLNELEDIKCIGLPYCVVTVNDEKTTIYTHPAYRKRRSAEGGATRRRRKGTRLGHRG